MKFTRNKDGGYFEATGENFYYQIHKGARFWKLYCRKGSLNPLQLIGTFPTKRRCVERAEGYDAS